MAHAMITGGADGIGRAVVACAASAGYAITLLDRDAARGQAVCQAIQSQGGSAHFVHTDLGDPKALAETLDVLAQLAPADLVVHSAGISAVGRFAELSLARQQAVLDINMRAPIQLTAGLLRTGKLADGGTLVFLASLSVFTGYPGAVAYAASKDGIAAYARSLRVALRPRKINVLTVYPGPTRTAHARRYSPDNRREARRMLPEQLARLIMAAVQRRQATLIPGVGNRVAALMGRMTPGLAEELMRIAIFAKLPPTGMLDDPSMRGQP
jgi:short-subunit dehydrogenase